MAPPRLARSLQTLRRQIDQSYPARSRASDGWIGDAAHFKQGDKSDHNPWYPKPEGGIVTALDITNDPLNGVDTDLFTDQLANSRDHRIKYIIANGYILDTRQGFHPWEWVRYTGINPHNTHMHISVIGAFCDDDREWDTPMLRVGEIDMLAEIIRSQLPGGSNLPLRNLLGWWDKWIVESWRNTQLIPELRNDNLELQREIAELRTVIEERLPPKG